MSYPYLGVDISSRDEFTGDETQDYRIAYAVTFKAELVCTAKCEGEAKAQVMDMIENMDWDSYQEFLQNDTFVVDETVLGVPKTD